MRKINDNIRFSESFGSIRQGIENQLDQYDFDLRCAAPGIIQSFNKENQTVVVQLAVKELIFIDRLQSLAIPQLGDVPLVIPKAGNFVITVPPKKGDECLIVFGDTCIDSWWEYGEEKDNPNSYGARDPMSIRRHDLSDAFAILGTWSKPRKIADYATDACEIRTLDGKNKVQIKDDLIKVVINENTYIEVKDGEINIKTSDKLNVETDGDVSITGGAKIDVTSNGDMTVESSGDIVIESSSVTLGSGTAKKLMTDDVINIFNNHTHAYLPGPGVSTPTAPPLVPLTSGNATTNTEAS